MTGLPLIEATIIAAAQYTHYTSYTERVDDISHVINLAPILGTMIYDMYAMFNVR